MGRYICWLLWLTNTFPALLKGWEKGVVFINSQNLGRYWNIGPQETLYLPGTWLDQGINQVGTLVVPSIFPGTPFSFLLSLVSQCFSGGGEQGRPLSQSIKAA